jgi:periplasmic protein TonB
MNSIHANAGAGGYQLKSEMARVCLPVPHAHAQRNLAWANSICLLFLIIGLVGFRPKPPPPLVVKPLEESAPVILEATPPPPPAAELKPQEEPKDQPPSEAPRVVVVTPDSPKIVFSVPTVGNVVVPNALAQAPPPAALLRRVAPAQSAPSTLSNTGEGGDRPKPTEYPPMARALGQEGSLMLLLRADDAGVITSATVKESSGSSILDHFSVEWVKRHWTVSPGASGRLFLAPFVYKLNSN